MILVAITGTICSGKSFVSKIVQKLGYPVFSCDEEIGKILKQKLILKRIGLEFPAVVFGNTLNKKRLSKIVFEDSQKKQRLEKILYPKLFDKQNKFIEILKKKGARIAFFEVPLLYEKNLEGEYSYVIATCADENTIACRVSKRKIDQKIFCNILKNQLPGKEKASRADYVINTDCSKKEIENKTKEIIKEVLNERSHT